MYTPTHHACGPEFFAVNHFFSPFLATYFLVTDFLFFVIVFGTLLFTHLEQLTPEIYVRVPLGFCPVLVYPRLPVLPGI